MSVRLCVRQSSARSPQDRRSSSYDRASLCAPASCISASAISIARIRRSISTPCSRRARGTTSPSSARASCPPTRRCATSSAAQDYLTTVVEQDNASTSARVTGAMIDMLPVGDTEAIVEKLADPGDPDRLPDRHRGRLFHRSRRQVRSGSSGDRRGRRRTRGAEDRVRPDLRRAESADGERGVSPFTVMSCDNIPHNGKVCAQRRRRHGAARRWRACRMDRRECRLSERHGRPHHPGDQPARDRPLPSRHSASTMPGRSIARNSSNGCWRTISPPAARRWRRSACSSCPTSRPTST